MSLNEPLLMSDDGQFPSRSAINVAEQAASDSSDISPTTETREAEMASEQPSSTVHQVAETNGAPSPPNVLLRVLGFSSNPFESSDLILAMISNFGTSYNVVNVGLVLDILSKDSVYGKEETEAADSLCASSLLMGMVVGQLAGGAFGDYLGRRRAIAIIMSLQVIASIGSATSVDVTAEFSIFVVLAMWRFILGVGCGGVYPLAATMTAESAPSEADRGKLVALTFSTQGVGFLCVPLVTWTLVSIWGGDGGSSKIWRPILGFGCIPGIIVLTLMMLKSLRRKCPERGTLRFYFQSYVLLNAMSNQDGDSSTASLPNSNMAPLEVAPDNTGALNEADKDEEDEEEMAAPKPSIWTAIREESNLPKKLCGTALSWFLFDVLFYGNTLFTPVVLSKAFGSSFTLASTARDATVLSTIALPGYFVSVFAIGQYQTPKFVQLQGFAFMAILYGLIGFFFKPVSNQAWLLVTLYGLTFFFANYGPNTTTFMLPSITFSPPCRSTLNGVSAACGKLGALLGATMFEPAADALGDAAVMIICAGVSLLALLLTWLCVSENDSEEDTNSAGGITRRNSAGRMV